MAAKSKASLIEDTTEHNWLALLNPSSISEAGSLISSSDITHLASSQVATASETGLSDSESLTKTVDLSSSAQWARDRNGDLQWCYSQACVEKWSAHELLLYFFKHAFSIPPRENNLPASFVYVQLTNSDGLDEGETIKLPHGYRTPLIFIGKYLWAAVLSSLTQLSSASTSTSTNSSTPESQSFGSSSHRTQILHLVRLTQNLFIRAKLNEARGGMEKGWRCVMFDRLLTRLWRRWTQSDPKSLQDFERTYGVKEYERDALKNDWKRWCRKGLGGTILTDDDVSNGITFNQCRSTLRFDPQKKGWKLRGRSITSALSALDAEDPAPLEKEVKVKQQEEDSDDILKDTFDITEWSSISELTDSDEDVNVAGLSKANKMPKVSIPPSIPSLKIKLTPKKRPLETTPHSATTGGISNQQAPGRSSKRLRIKAEAKAAPSLSDTDALPATQAAASLSNFATGSINDSRLTLTVRPRTRPKPKSIVKTTTTDTDTSTTMSRTLAAISKNPQFNPPSSSVPHVEAKCSEPSFLTALSSSRVRNASISTPEVPVATLSTAKERNPHLAATKVGPLLTQGNILDPSNSSTSFGPADVGKIRLPVVPPVPNPANLNLVSAVQAMAALIRNAQEVSSGSSAPTASVAPTTKASVPDSLSTTSIPSTKQRPTTSPKPIASTTSETDVDASNKPTTASSVSFGPTIDATPSASSDEPSKVTFSAPSPERRSPSNGPLTSKVTPEDTTIRLSSKSAASTSTTGDPAATAAKGSTTEISSGIKTTQVFPAKTGRRRSAASRAKSIVSGPLPPASAARDEPTQPSSDRTAHSKAIRGAAIHRTSNVAVVIERRTLGHPKPSATQSSGGTLPDANIQKVQEGDKSSARESRKEIKTLKPSSRIDQKEEVGAPGAEKVQNDDKSGDETVVGSTLCAMHEKEEIVSTRHTEGEPRPEATQHVVIDVEQHTGTEAARGKRRARSRSSSVEIIEISTRQSADAPSSSTSKKIQPPVLSRGRRKAHSTIVEKVGKWGDDEQDSVDSDVAEECPVEEGPARKKRKIVAVQEDETKGDDDKVTRRALEMLVALVGKQEMLPIRGRVDGEDIGEQGSAGCQSSVSVAQMKELVVPLKEDMGVLTERLKDLDKRVDDVERRVALEPQSTPMAAQDATTVASVAPAGQTTTVVQRQSLDAAESSLVAKTPTLDLDNPELRTSLAIIVDNLVSTKLLSLNKTVDLLRSSGKPSDLESDSATRLGSPSTSLGLSASSTSISNDAAQDTAVDIHSINALHEEIKALREEAIGRDQRTKEELHDMRKLHSAEVDALRRRLAILESQSLTPFDIYDRTRQYPPSLSYNGYTMHRESAQRYGSDYQNYHYRSRDPHSMEFDPGHGSASVPTSRSFSPPLARSANPARRSDVQISGKADFHEEDGPLPIKSQRKQHIIALSRNQIG